MDLFESAARQNFEGWGKSEEVLRGLMVEKLEIMCSAFYGRVATGAVLRVDAECDLLVVTLALKGRGGIPVNRLVVFDFFGPFFCDAVTGKRSSFRRSLWRALYFRSLRNMGLIIE